MRLSDIKAGVVGVGFIGVTHVEALRRLGVDVVGVVGGDLQRARAKAKAANLPRVFEDLDQLLSTDVDVIHVASPNHVHAEQALAALEAGKHVVCEKPLGLDSQQTAALLAVAQSSGLVNAVCLNVRFYPQCHQLRAMVNAGDLGSPRLVTGSYLQDWMLLETDWNWRLVPEEAGPLRSVADIGSHWLDLASFVSGRRVVEVFADLHTLVPVRRRPVGPVETFAAGTGADGDERVEEIMTSDDAAGILLRFEGGAAGTLTVSQVSAGRKNSLTIEVDGAESSASWCSEEPDRLLIGHRGRPNEVLYRDPGALYGEAGRLAAYPAGHVEGYPDTFRALFADVYADIHRGRPSDDPTYPTFADGHDVVLVTEAVATSATEQRWTPVRRPPS